MICTECGRTVTTRHWYASGQPRCWKRTWTRARIWKLMELIERGWEDARIAEALGTTATAVNLARKRNGIASRSDTLLSCRTAAERLGISCSKTVSRWAELGWVKATRGPRQGPHRQWQIRPDDLLAFLEQPQHWHRWEPERIPDLALRRWATEIRQGTRFLTLGEVAARYYVQPATVHQWIKKGWLPAVRQGEKGNHLVRECDLAGFALPQIGGYRRAA